MSKKYILTDEHKALLPVWRDKWIANTMSTKPMDDEEKALCREAVKGLYLSAGKTPPPDHRIVFVSSPFMLRFAAGFAAAIWYLRKNKKFKVSAATYDATYDATRAATRDATIAATYDATIAATYDATRAATIAATYDATIDATRAATIDATRAATRAATIDATYDATRAATIDATYDATRAATYDATIDATRAATWYSVDMQSMIRLSKALQLGSLGLQCATSIYRLWQGGNQWSAWDSFLTFFRHVAKLPIDYSKYDNWEMLAMHSGPRVVHEEFCMISDRPEVLLVDGQNRPHCETGPFCKWRDGTALYSLHGIRVAAWVVETPKDKIDPKKVLAIENTEERHAAMKHIGIYKFLDSLKAEQIHEFVGYRLYYLIIGDNKCGPYLYMQCPSSGREFLEGVGDADKYEFIDPTIKTCNDALKWRASRASNALMTKYNENYQFKA